METIDLKNSMAVRMAAELLGVSRQYIHKLIKTGKLTPIRLEGTSLIMLKRDEISKLIEKREEKTDGSKK